jgi:hypothetical protein
MTNNRYDGAPNIALGRRLVIGLVILCAVSYVVQLHILLQLHRLDDINESPLTKSHETTDSVGAVVDDKLLLSPSTSSKNVHIVFSTDCSGYQHYQSIASYYSIRRSGHLGPTTRIVSGCAPSQQHAITQEFNKIDPTKQHLQLHFTPSFSLNGKHYKYSNKPGGMLHWITNTTINEDVIALIDPDMMLLRPITPILKQDLTEVLHTNNDNNGGQRKKMLEYKDKDGRIHLLRQNKLPPLPPLITKGVAAGQHFGLGGYWASAGKRDATNDFKQFNLTIVCGPSSPCLNEPSTNSSTMHYTTREEADNNYAVGPVYIATTADWQDLLPKWHEFTPRVYEQYPKLLAEMYGFTMAAADRQLKFALSSSYMISDARTMSPTESWLWIDEYGERSARAVCDGAGIDRLPTETLRRLKHYGYGYQDILFTDNNDLLLGAGPLPTTLHYCQRYEFANHVFAKRKIPHDFFRCDGTPLKFDIDAIMRELDSIEESGLSGNQRKVKLRMAYMICHLTPLMNLALVEYKVDMKC